jgi:hypothetical protein
MNATKSRPRVKPARCCRMTEVEAGRVLSITMGSPPHQRQTHYHLAEIAVDHGRGFEVRKFSTDGGDIYHVHFDQETGDSCTCLGWLRWSRCKQCDALAALIKLGVL